MAPVKPLTHVNNSSLSNVKPVKETKPITSQKPEQIEFKFTPSMDKITKPDAMLTGTYNNKGKLALISNKMIVYVHPSAYIRDKMVPSYKAVV